MNRSSLHPSPGLIVLGMVMCATALFAAAAQAATTPPVATTPLGAPRSAPTVSLVPNMLVNGDFEITTVVPGCYYNLANAQVNTTLTGITAYGPAQEIDVMSDGAACIFGPLPQSGIVKLAIHKQSTGASDEFSFGLTSPVVAGQVYDVSCYAAADVTFDPNIGAVEIGLSNTPTSFGTLVFSNSPNIGTWTPLLHTFVAPVNGSFLTVRVGGPVMSWVHVDHFVLTPGGPVPTLRKNWAAVKAVYR